MGYEFRISAGGEVHIFKDESFSICKRVLRIKAKELGIYEGSSLSRKRQFSDLSEKQAQELASVLNSLGINVCGTCVSHLYKT